MKGMHKIGMNTITHLHTYYDTAQVVKGRHIFSIAELGNVHLIQSPLIMFLEAKVEHHVKQ